MMRISAYLLLASSALLSGCGLGRPVNPGPPPLPETNLYAIETDLGTMVVELSDRTPIHRDNFKRLVAEGFYDGTTFHRVVLGFMVQGGDPKSRDDDPANDGRGGPGYTLPAEIDSTLTHEVGALAAARQSDAANPERRSNGSQFYLASGDLARRLDGEYSIFGKVVEGFDVLERLQQLMTPRRLGRTGPRGQTDRPFDPVSMTIRPVPGSTEGGD